MDALVLVGGEGTRLRPLTLTQPKPAIRLVDRPFIRFMVDWLGRHGIERVVMACGFRAQDLRAAVGHGVRGGPRIEYLEEPEPLGTAGPVRLAAEGGLLGDRFMVLNGDVLADLDLTALRAAHSEARAVATLALYPVDDAASYGLVRRRDDGEVLEFVEKPDPAEIDTDEINAGAYVLEREVVDLITADRSVSIEREVFPRLVGNGLYGRRLDGYWMDIGTPGRYLQATWDIVEGRVETEVGPPDANAVLADDGVEVADDAAVGPRAVLGRGTTIAAGAAVSESVLFAGCRIGAAATVRGSILASGVEVGESARVKPGAVIGEQARIGSGATVDADARIGPGEEVAA